MIREDGAGVEARKMPFLGFNPASIFSFPIILPLIILPDSYGLMFGVTVNVPVANVTVRPAAVTERIW